MYSASSQRGWNLELCSFLQDDVLQSGSSGCSASDPFCVDNSKTRLHREPKEGCFMSRKGGGFLGGKGGLLGGHCVSMEVCKEERDGDDETPVFDVLSLNEK